MTWKCGENNEVAHELPASKSLMFLPHWDVLCDLLLNRRTTAWNLFVLYNDQERKKTDTHTCLVPLDCSRICATVSDKNSWDTLTKCCFFRSRAPLVPLKVVYRGLVTKSCTPTLRGQGDPKVSQPFWLRLCFWGILGMWLLVGSSGGKSLGRYMHVSEPFFREKH